MYKEITTKEECPVCGQACNTYLQNIRIFNPYENYVTTIQDYRDDEGKLVYIAGQRIPKTEAEKLGIRYIETK